MTVSVQTVREEHEQFLPHVASIKAVADAIDRTSEAELLVLTVEIHEFLAHRLLPHAVAEGRVLFPLVRDLTGSPDMALGMNQCHIQLGRLTDELDIVRKQIERDGLGRDLENELRRVLYGTHTLLTAHFAQAEDVFTAALAHLAPEERERRFGEVERRAREITDTYE